MNVQYEELRARCETRELLCNCLLYIRNILELVALYIAFSMSSYFILCRFHCVDVSEDRRNCRRVETQIGS